MVSRVKAPMHIHSREWLVFWLVDNSTTSGQWRLCKIRGKIIWVDPCCTVHHLSHTSSYYRTTAGYYAALLLRRGPHIASHSVCPSVCLSVRPVIERHVAPPSELQWHTEGRISYGHLGRTNLFRWLLTMMFCMQLSSDCAFVILSIIILMKAVL